MTRSIEEELRQVLEQFPEIELAILFGSLASDRSRPSMSADLDIAVSTGTEISSALRRRLVDTLAERFGRPVDLIDLAVVGGPLLGNILKTGRRLLCRNPRIYAETVKRHIFNVADFEPYRKRLLEQRRKAWIES